mmetsp:Transcript_46853/g.101776  ORF Transcript_46853/g.101776 Transcript_46853/m.101776 type:complete len:354 (+) Transcript_46853:83-1144(+)
MSWCTIESDPGVFSELVAEMGVSDVQVHELYSLDKEAMASLAPVHGLIFLFRWRQEKDDRPTVTNYNDYLFFASQMITNACATQAILSILLNRPEIDLGEELTAFKAFTKDFPPDLKGLAISNSELLRRAHNSFARPEPFVAEERRSAKDDDDVYHFISYLPVDGKLYELDGLKAGPICLGDATNEDWLEVVRPLIMKRIEQYSSREIRFNLMAVTADRRERLLREQAVIEKERNMTVGKVQARSGKLPSASELERLAQQHPEPPAMGEVAVDERSLQELLIALAHLTARSNRIQGEISIEAQRVEQWRLENIRRRHNYVPFLVNFLKILAERNELMPLLENAKKKQRSQSRA